MSSDPSDSKKPEPRIEGRAPERGLPSVGQARADRKRMKWFPPRFWLWAMTAIGAGLIIWWKVEQGEIETMKGELLSKQRSVVKELGPRWFPLREKIEKWTTACSVEAFADKPAPDLVKDWDFRDKPGIYLRLAQAAAKSPKTIREAATKSLRDGFTSCLFTVDNPSPLSGPECYDSANCPDKHLCNEFYHCQEPSQPVNLRLAYKSLHMLSDEWVADIQEISNKLTARGALATFDNSNKFDLPVATDLLVRSTYFMVVVDEAVDVEGNDISTALPEVDAGRQDDRSIPTAPHPARICLYRLEDGEQMFAMRTDASGELRGVTAGAKVGMQTQIAQQRQANSCALALAVRDSIGADRAAQVANDDDPTEGEGGQGGQAGAEDGKGGSAPAASSAPSATAPSATAAPSAKPPPANDKKTP